ncbi:MAG: dUTP diphosphatase [bacterium]
MILKIKKLHPDAKIPKYAHHDDAGFDLFAIENILLKKGERAMIPTGVAMEIPEGYVGLVWDKSGLAMKHGIKTMGGVVDSMYRGEIMIGLINLSNEDYVFEKGHKIVQMVIQKKETVDFKEVKELSDTVRGKGGFGSTGK